MLTFETLIDAQERVLAERTAARAAHLAEQTTLLDTAEKAGRSSLDEAEQKRFDELSAAKRSIDAELPAIEAKLAELRAEAKADEDATRAAQTAAPGAKLPQRSPTVVLSEPETYRKGGNVSYFRDLYRATNLGDTAAAERLARNDLEVRALSTADGAGGEFVPPAWMIDEYVGLARAGRVVADQVRHESLPGGTDSIKLPSVATGTATAQQTINTAVQQTDATTSSVTADVFTVAGGQLVPQQLLDQSPINIDAIILADLAADYATKLDVAVINSANANGKGLLQVSGINGVTYTDASPTVAELYPKFADATQQIHTNRFMPAEKHFMHPRRWAWLEAAVDSQGRPLVLPAANMPANVIAAMGDIVAEGFVGMLQGLPVFVDPNIPTNLGAGTNEDRVITARTSDVILYEGNPRAEAFREVNAKEIQVFFRFFNYYALHSARYPKSISVISGTGLAAPTF